MKKKKKKKKERKSVQSYRQQILSTSYRHPHILSSVQLPENNVSVLFQGECACIQHILLKIILKRVFIRVPITCSIKYKHNVFFVPEHRGMKKVIYCCLRLSPR